jgi:xylulokinase
MSSALRCVAPKSVVTGWDFSTGAVKCLAFGVDGAKLAEVRMPTDLWHGGPDPAEQRVSELNLLQLEGQALASTRAIAARLRDWIAGGISATHHTAGRIDSDRVPIRRAICWNDPTLAKYHAAGHKRLGAERVARLIGGPWAIRYSLSHLVKDEATLPEDAWRRTWRILPHGPLAAGYLTGNFDVTSVSSAASTGMMHLGKMAWAPGMLGALAEPRRRKLVLSQLPRIVDACEPVGRLAPHVAAQAGIDGGSAPWIFPTSDDQQAGLIGGGATESGHVAVILGTSVVVNSAMQSPPDKGRLDVMRLNWGPYLWMRCYNNGADFLNHVVGERPDWRALEREGRACPPGCDGVAVLPFLAAEPSLKIDRPTVQWFQAGKATLGQRYRASLEALAFLIAMAVAEHVKAGQQIRRITVSGGIARSDLLCEILAGVLGMRLERLESDEGPALGAAVTALAAIETRQRIAAGIDEPMPVAAAVEAMVRYRKPMEPRGELTEAYARRLPEFRKRVQAASRGGQ